MSYPVYIDDESGADKSQVTTMNSIINSNNKLFQTVTSQVQAGETLINQVINRERTSALVAGILDFNYLYFNTLAFTLRTDFDWETNPDGTFVFYELFELKPGIDIKIDSLGFEFDQIAYTGVNNNTTITQLLSTYVTLTIRWKPSSGTYAIYAQALSQPPKTTWGIYATFLYIPDQITLRV